METGFQHTRCCSTAPYAIEVDGILTAEGIRRGSFRIIVLGADWEIRDTDRAPSDGSVPVRLSGTIAAPALYDAHVHLHPDVDLSSYVAYGVTRIRDLGSVVGAHNPLSRTESCARPMPEVVLGGPLVDRPGKPRLPIASPWRVPDELPALFDAAAERGASWIKLYDGFSAALFPKAVELAHSRGLRVTVHPAPGDYTSALAAGVDELQHLACLTPRGDGVRGTHAVHRRWAGRTTGDTWPDLPPGTTVCPTLLVHHRLVHEARLGWPFHGHDRRLVTSWRTLPTVAKPWTAEQLGCGRRALAELATAVRRLDGAGITWRIGSDTPNPGLWPGRSMWEEMNLLIASGLDKRAVYRAASVAPGLRGSGSHPLLFLSAASWTAGPFPVERPAATLLRGCLFRTETRVKESNGTEIPA